MSYRIKKRRKRIRMSPEGLTCGSDGKTPFDGHCHRCGALTEAIGMPEGSPYEGRKLARCPQCALAFFFYSPGEAPVTDEEEEAIFEWLGINAADVSFPMRDTCPRCGAGGMEVLTIRPGLRGAGRHIARCPSCSWGDFVMLPGDAPLPASEADAIMAEAGAVAACGTSSVN
jgi:hypothetical protein